MGRPSKLTPAQWDEVERRAAEGEVVRALAKEFGVDEAAIRRRVNPQTPQIRKVAAKLAEVRTELEALPVSQQYVAINLADKLRNISSSLASAAELGAATAHRLQALANSEVAKVDDADPLQSLDALRGVGVLTKLAIDSASIAMGLVSANKEAAAKATAPAEIDDGPPQRERIGLDAWKHHHGLA